MQDACAIDLSQASGELGPDTWFSNLYFSALESTFTGAILVRNQAGDRVAFFRDGQPLHAGGSGFRSALLGEILVGEHKCSGDQLDRALARQGDAPNRPLLGTCLIDLGIPPDDIQRAVIIQTRRRIQELLGIASGSWQSAAGESERVRALGVPFNGWPNLIDDLSAHGSDEELKQYAIGLLGDSVVLRLGARIAHPAIGAVAEPILRYLTRPRKPDQLERALGNRRLVRAALKILEIAGALERVPAARAIAIPNATNIKNLVLPGPPAPREGRGESLEPGVPAKRAGPTSDTRLGQEPPGAAGTPEPSQDRTAEVLRRQELAKLSKEVSVFHASMAAKSHLDLLGVDRSSNPAELRKAFTAFAKRFHPDALGPSAPPELLEQVKDISARLNEAYEVLTDSDRRAEYLALLDDKRFLGDAHKAAKSRDAEVKGQMGLVMLRRRDFGRARELLSFAMEADPNQPIHKAHYAWALFADPKSDRGQAMEEAHRFLLEAEKQNPKHPVILGYLGQLQKARGETQAALGTFRRVVQLEPKNADALREIRLLTSRAEKAERRNPLKRLLKR